MIGYQTAYLKAHYTAEFMAALLSSEIDDGNKRDIFVDHIADARRLGVDVLPPDVNAGEADFTVHDGKIIFGLTASKVWAAAPPRRLSGRTAKAAVSRPVRFLRTHRPRAVMQSAIEKLIKAGGSTPSASGPP